MTNYYGNRDVIQKIVVRTTLLGTERPLSDLVVSVDTLVGVDDLSIEGRSGFREAIESDSFYLRPAWFLDKKSYKSLFVWCDEHLRWNHHGCLDEETIKGTLTARCPHHRPCDGAFYYCMGQADNELAKILRRYNCTTNGAQTVPFIRRVYVRKVATEKP